MTDRGFVIESLSLPLWSDRPPIDDFLLIITDHFLLIITDPSLLWH